MCGVLSDFAYNLECEQRVRCDSEISCNTFMGNTDGMIKLRIYYLPQSLHNPLGHFVYPTFLQEKEFKESGRPLASLSCLQQYFPLRYTNGYVLGHSSCPIKYIKV